MSDFEKDLLPHETDLVGSWVVQGGRVVADDVSQRIKWLIERRLSQLGHSRDAGAWETAYRDPSDGRLWERTFPQSEMHGGGPPSLRVQTEQDSLRRYHFEVRGTR